MRTTYFILMQAFLLLAILSANPVTDQGNAGRAHASSAHR